MSGAQEIQDVNQKPEDADELAHRLDEIIRSGAGLNLRNCQLRRFPVKVVDGAVLVRVAGRDARLRWIESWRTLGSFRRFRRDGYATELEEN